MKRVILVISLLLLTSGCAGHEVTSGYQEPVDFNDEPSTASKVISTVIHSVGVLLSGASAGYAQNQPTTYNCEYVYGSYPRQYDCKRR